MGQSRHFQIGSNQELWFDVPFTIGQIVIDNPGTYWVHFPESWGGYAFVWPQRFGATVPPPIAGPGQLHVTTKDTPPGQTPSGASSAVATLTVYEAGGPLAGDTTGPATSTFNPGQALATVDSNAADIQRVTQTFANRSAGTVGLAADAGHVHVGWLNQIMMLQAGPLPFTTPSFTINFAGSSLLLMLGASAIKLNAAGLLHVAFALDAGGFNDRTVYSSAFGPNEHRAFPMIQGLFGGLTAGGHTVTVKTNDANTGSDGNDQYALQLWEVPP